MKRFVLLLTVVAILLSSCSYNVKNKEDTLEQFTEALRVYDREAMTDLLTEFPDKTPYVYLDDIFNDDKYIELYRILYPEITYAVTSSENDRLVVEYTMPDVQALYTGVVAMVMNLAMSDESLVDKLDENEENGIILIQEMMLALARQGNSVTTTTREYTLSFKEENGKTVIVCDDELRALITGNFFLSKKSTLAELNDQSK